MKITKGGINAPQWFKDALTVVLTITAVVYLCGAIAGLIHII